MQGTVVLVTDSVATTCDNAGASDTGVVEAVSMLASGGVPTYVLGMQNPVTTDGQAPPDHTAALDELAEAGGTISARMLNTESPAVAEQSIAPVLADVADTA